MAPAEFFLFTKLKLPLRGTCFQLIEGNGFKKCFDVWIIRWYKCIIWEGPTLKAIK